MTQHVDRAKAYRGAAIEIGGYAASQLLRLLSNLILTRLLFPEAFGIAALVLIFVQGLAMLSDAGFEQSVVQNKRGEDPDFLNTAWTMGLLRAGALLILACVGAWPMSQLYNEPMLAYLIPIAAFTLLFNGLASTSIYIARRRLDIYPLFKIDMASQLMSLTVVLVWASWSPSVWALVFSGVIASMIRMGASHLLVYGPRNRLAMEPKSLREIFHFGKWIFGSSALSFLSRQADRLVIGALVGPSTLGIYSIAVFMGDAVSTGVIRVTSGVLYPVLSRVAREQSANLGAIFYAARLRTDVLGLLPIGALMILAPLVIRSLYDARYHDAGWMLQLLCIKIALSIVIESIQNCLFSMGLTHHGFVQSAIRAASLAVGLPTGWAFLEVEGLVWAVALAEVPVIAYVWYVFSRVKLLNITRECLSFLVLGFGLLLGTATKYLVNSLL